MPVVSGERRAHGPRAGVAMPWPAGGSLTSHFETRQHSSSFLFTSAGARRAHPRIGSRAAGQLG